MRSSAFLAVLVLAISTQSALAQRTDCPTYPSEIVYIHKSHNDAENDANVGTVVDKVGKENTWVLLDSDVEITFSMSNVPNASPGDPFIRFGRCVTLASYALIISPPPVIDDLSRFRGVPEPGAGRTPHSLGPRLRYLDDGRATDASFIEMHCVRNSDDPSAMGDGAHIKGIRVSGPNDDDHHTNERGIFINGCHDVEIANNEIHGWGGAAIRVQDSELIQDLPDHFPDREPDEIFIKIHDNYIHHNQDSDGDGYGVDVQHGAFAEIFQNVFDFNKHSITAAGDSGGYHAFRNLILKGGGFRNKWYERNIHVVDVHGTKNCPTVGEGVVGGLVAGAGLGAIIGLLVGGGPGAIVTGGFLGILGGAVGGLLAGHNFLCGDAGFNFVIVENTFQYSKTLDIKIRGKPKKGAEIRGNVFARSSKDDAIQDGEAQWYCFWACTSHNDNVVISGDNKFNDDTYGKYGVCDVDGDGIDDLVLMTGNTWWFSSAGRYPWSFLKTDPAILKDVQLGDFDGDGRCDVMKGEEGSGPTGERIDAPFKWLISSGARENFKLLVPSIAPLNEVRFGRFDPNSPDFSRGIKRPTHAFWRNAEGFWFVTPISQPSGWTLVQSSSFPLADLRFGSFTGNGVTDVLANEGPGSHWAISRAARGGWENLNPTLHDPVKNANIFIANMKADDNKDDILRLNIKFDDDTYDIKWQWSNDGTWPSWSEWKGYVFTIGSDKEDYVGPVGFVGQFSAPPGASTLTIDESRVGHFFSHLPDGREAGWLSNGVDDQRHGADNQPDHLFHY
jgi:Right handed beta helix region